MNKKFNKEVRKEWSVDNSSFDAYVNLVRFPSGTAIAGIEKRIGKSVLNTALDIAGGSKGNTIKDLIRDGYIGRGAFTNLVDSRDEQSKSPLIELIEGDLLISTTWSRLKSCQERIAPGGFDLVMHRPYGALQDLSLAEYTEMADRKLDLTKSGGLIYAQIPTSYAYEKLNEDLVGGLEEHYRELSEVELVERTSPRENLADHQYFLIHKR